MVEKRVRQTISDDDDDDDDRHYFRNVYTNIKKMNTFFGFYSNTLEYCQINPHESDRNDV